MNFVLGDSQAELHCFAGHAAGWPATLCLMLNSAWIRMETTAGHSLQGFC